MSPPSRRWFIGGAAMIVAGAAGGTAGWFTARPAPRRRPADAALRPDPVLLGAVRREQELIGRLDAAAASAPTLGPRIDVLRVDHRAHLEALQALVGPPVAPDPATPAAGQVPSVRPQAAVPTAPELATLEMAAATAAARDSARSRGPAAVILGSISACEATHAAWLT